MRIFYSIQLKTETAVIFSALQLWSQDGYSKYSKDVFLLANQKKKHLGKSEVPKLEKTKWVNQEVQKI